MTEKNITSNLSLLFNYAIMHEVFLNLEDDARYHLTRDFMKRVCENGLVANLGDGAWIQEFYKICSKKNVNQYRVNNIFQLLDRLKDTNRLYYCPPTKKEQESWSSLAVQVHKNDPFYAIVMSGSNPDFKEFDKDVVIDFSPKNDAFDLLEKIEGKRNIELSKTTSDFTAALRPLLQYVDSVMVVDPYANYSDRYLRSIKIILSLIGKRRSFPVACSLEIHAGDPRHRKLGGIDIKEHLSRWRKALQPLVNDSGHIVQIFLRNMSLGRKNFHNRFVITNQCGVQVPYGFDCYEDDGSDDQWTLLDKDVSDNIKNTYTKNPKFALLYRPLILAPEI